MDHVFGLYLLVALGLAGALRMIPLVLEDTVSAFEQSLRVLAKFVRVFRSWRAQNSGPKGL